MERNESQTGSVKHGDGLPWQKSGQYLQVFRKKVWKTVSSLKLLSFKARNFAKNLWNVTKLKLDL